MTKHTDLLVLALKEAEKGRGFCAPNPAVGAVIVKNGEVIATGYHTGPGKPHAEVEAIAKLTDADCHDADIYVTLEPCSHYGRTPPCADLLIKKKFGRVFYGFQDPNPIVAGRGVEKIQTAGITCQLIELSEVKEFYHSYFYWTVTRKPYVTAKIAISLDGKIGIVAKNPTKLTGMIADQYTHQQRRMTDGILSTVKTIIADNPRFNARTADGEYQKKLFLIGGKDHLPSETVIFNSTESITLYNDKLQSNLKKEIKQVEIPRNEYGLNLTKIIEDLGKQGLHDLWVEVGATLLNQLLQQQLLNRLIIYISPKILGKGTIDAFLNFYQLPIPQWQLMGEDVMAEFIF